MELLGGEGTGGQLESARLECLERGGINATDSLVDAVEVDLHCGIEGRGSEGEGSGRGGMSRFRGQQETERTEAGHRNHAGAGAAMPRTVRTSPIRVAGVKGFRRK